MNPRTCLREAKRRQAQLSWLPRSWCVVTRRYCLDHWEYVSDYVPRPQYKDRRSPPVGPQTPFRRDIRRARSALRRT